MKYQGQELHLFKHAINWKKYFAGYITPYIKGTVLEVGAGIGTITPYLNNGSANSWTLLEPDEDLVNELKEKKSINKFPPNTIIKPGTIDNVLHEKYDTIIYIDVLEHIEMDTVEVKKAANLLNPDGFLIILAPAFQFLFSPFDKAIGHYRRYNDKGYITLTPASLSLQKIKYLDSMGFVSAVVNRFLLKQSYPTPGQIKLWDSWLIPVSRLLDRLFFYSIGKSILGIWKKKSTI